MPHRFRLAMASQPAVLSAVLTAVLTALMQEVFNYQRRMARRMSVTSPQPGAIAFVQRFGSSLNLHLHIHVWTWCLCGPIPAGLRKYQSHSVVTR